jgi:hypothetical protein
MRLLDLSTFMINAAFESLVKNVSCKDCQDGSKARIREVLTSWAAVKVGFLSIFHRHRDRSNPIVYPLVHDLKTPL